MRPTWNLAYSSKIGYMIHTEEKIVHEVNYWLVTDFPCSFLHKCAHVYECVMEQHDQLKQCNNSHKAYMYTIQTLIIDKLLGLRQSKSMFTCKNHLIVNFVVCSMHI